jgi:hypothetical protein
MKEIETKDVDSMQNYQSYRHLLTKSIKRFTLIIDKKTEKSNKCFVKNAKKQVGL